ncbi:MAG: hypothetical protein WAO95_00930 [Burkholderiales bacterium]
MLLTKLIFVALLCVSPFFSTSFAKSPREQLNQFVTQLQSNPGDNALRERIVKLAQEIKPPPAMPEEAERRLGRGQAAFKIAKEPSDFEKAIAEFNAASIAAPWLATPYYNLGVAQEAAKRYREAMASFRLYLLASPGLPDAGEVRQRIFSLEYLAEQPAPLPPKPTDEQLLAQMNGARFMRTGVSVPVDSRGDAGYELNGKVFDYISIARELGPDDRRYNPHLLNNPRRVRQDHFIFRGNLKWEVPREKICIDMFATWQSCEATTFEISPDGRTLTTRGFSYSDRAMFTVSYPRAN